MVMKYLILIISNSALAIVLVGFIGGLWENLWLGNLGTKKFKDQPSKNKLIIPAVMFFFPLPFTTYTYIFFRVVTGKNPHINMKKIGLIRNKIFDLYSKKNTRH